MKKLISLAVSLAILAIIYAKIDIANLFAAFEQTDLAMLAAAIGMAIPITLLTAWRLQILAPDGVSLGLAEATRLILAASVLNMVLPSKMGDVAKSYFMSQQGHMSGSLALSVVVFEKASDMLALLIWCAFGLALFPRDDPFFLALTLAVGGGLVFCALMVSSLPFANWFFDLAEKTAPAPVGVRIRRFSEAWTEMHGYFWRRRRFALGIIAFSTFLWFLHLGQIWWFALSLGTGLPLIANLALVPLAILAGLVPMTFAGIGTRDAALIVLLLPYMSVGSGAALGLLCTLRYLLPALGGLPYFNRYLKAMHPDRDAA